MEIGRIRLIVPPLLTLVAAAGFLAAAYRQGSWIPRPAFGQTALFALVGAITLWPMPGVRRRFPALVQAFSWRVPLIGLLLLLAAIPTFAGLLAMIRLWAPAGLVGILLMAMALYFSQVLVAWGLGQLLAERVGFMRAWPWPLLFLAGTLAMSLLPALPWVGWIFALFWWLCGAGGLWYLLTEGKE